MIKLYLDEELDWNDLPMIAQALLDKLGDLGVSASGWDCANE